MQETWGQPWDTRFLQAKEELQGVCNGPSCLGEKTQVLPRTTAAFPPALAVPLPAAVFSPYVMFYYTSWKGLQGRLRESYEFSRACTVCFGGKRAPTRSKRFLSGSVCLFPRLLLFFLSEPPQAGGSLVTVMLCL